MAGVVGRTYSYFRPFIDEAHGEGAEDPATIRSATRNALNALDRLASISRQWHKSYQKHAAEVIAFINATTPDQTPIYGYFSDLPGLGAGRFVGSIPPGFQDRRKKGSEPHPKENESAPADSNRFGDLVFWKETLDHAEGTGARAIIVLTNDRKNDWHLGRSQSVKIEPDLLAIKKDWEPVPRTHPMLVMEAKLAARVEEVELLDSPYLAALLREMAEVEVRAFADVAIVPDGTVPEGEGERRDKLLKDRLSADAAQVAALAAEQGYIFPDAPEVIVSPASLRRALLDSRQPISDRGAMILEEWRSTVAPRRPLREALAAEALDGLDQKELVKLARELHDRVLNAEAGYAEVLADLVSLLDAIPPDTSSCIYLGLLASMYMARDTNASRIPPRSPVAQLLLARQSTPVAVGPIAALAKRIRDNDFAPVYIPASDPRPVSATLDTEPNTPELDELRSLRIAGIELLTAAQTDDALRLAALFDAAGAVDGDAIVRKACELFAIPSAQIERTEAFKGTYALSATIGFKRPVDVSVPKEQILGD